MRIHSASGHLYSDTGYAGPNGAADWTALFRASMDLATLPQFDFGARISTILAFAGTGGEEMSISAWRPSGSLLLQLGIFATDGTNTAERYSTLGSMPAATDFRGLIRVTGTSWRCWIDGVEIGFNAAGPFAPSSGPAAGLNFANLTGGISLIPGSASEIGDVVFYHRALSVAECVAATSLASPVYPGTEAYFDALQTSGAGTATGGSFAAHTPVVAPTPPPVDGTVTETRSRTDSVVGFISGQGSVTETRSRTDSVVATTAANATVTETRSRTDSVVGTVSTPAGTFTIDRATTLMPFFGGMRSTIDMSESDSPIVANPVGATLWKFDVPEAVYGLMWTRIAAQRLDHIRIDIDGARSAVGGTFGGSGPGGTGFTEGPYVSTGHAVAVEVADAKIDAWIRHRAAVAAEGRAARMTLQCVMWADTNVHIDPPGDPGQNAADFVVSFLERARLTYGMIPDILCFVNEADNTFIRGGGVNVPPAILARSFSKLVAALDAIPNQPYRRMRLVYPEVTGMIDDFGNPFSADDIDAYLSALQTENAALLADPRFALGFHPYPDGNLVNGLATIPVEKAAFSIAEAFQGEFWYDSDGPISGPNANDDYRTYAHSQVTISEAALMELHTIGAFPVLTAGERDWGQLVSTAPNAWGTAITDYVPANRRAVVYPYVRYLQWGARRISEITPAGTVRATSWETADKRVVVIMEETGLGSTVALAGFGAVGDWASIEIDRGAGLVAASPASIALAANELVAVVFTPTSVSGSVTETRSRTDSVIATISVEGTVTETRSRTDSVAATISVPGTVTEARSRTDSVVATTTAVGTVVNARSRLDSVVATTTAAGTITESRSRADSVVASASVEGTVTETRSRLDSVTATTVAVGAVTETRSRADSVVGTVSVTGQGSVTETRSRADSVVATTAANGAVTETRSRTDSVVATVDTPGVVSGTVTETRSRADSVVATTVANATVTETRSRTDSVTPTLDAPTSPDPFESAIVATGNLTSLVIASGALTSNVIKRHGDMTEFKINQQGYIEAYVTTQDANNPTATQAAVDLTTVTNAQFAVHVNGIFKGFVSVTGSAFSGVGNGSDGWWLHTLAAGYLDTVGDWDFTAVWDDVVGDRVSAESIRVRVLPLNG